MSASETTYWNGEPTEARRLSVIVPEWREGDPPLAWWRPLAGQERKAVLVQYPQWGPYLLDDDDGRGWRKITEGHGSPNYGHRDLPLRSQEVVV